MDRGHQLPHFVQKRKLSIQLRNHLIAGKYAKTLEGWDEFDDDKKEELRTKASQHLEAFIYLDNADQAKYGSVLKGLHDQMALNNDEFPRSLLEATNHKIIEPGRIFKHRRSFER